MKVIDVMQKVANGEIFKFNIKGIDDCTYFVNENHCICDNTDGDLVEWLIDDEWLNREVEIIEEDKNIEKIKILNCDNYVKKGNYETILTMQEIALDIQTLRHKLNEIIDYLEEKE